MKRKILYSLVVGFVLLLLSLLYKTGPSSVEPMPYVNGGCGHGGVCGVVAYPQGGLQAPDSSSNRGFPLPAASLTPDDDNPASYYKSLNLLNTAIDFAIFCAVAFALITLIAHLLKQARAPKIAPKRNKSR